MIFDSVEVFSHFFVLYLRCVITLSQHKNNILNFNDMKKFNLLLLTGLVLLPAIPLSAQTFEEVFGGVK